MLVLTRKKGETLLIGEDIEITVVKLEDGAVKLGIKAPNDITILRKELYKDVESENKNAVLFDIDMLNKINK